MSHSQFQSKRFILRRAWLSLWDERMTTGRINQVATVPKSIIQHALVNSNKRAVLVQHQMYTLSFHLQIQCKQNILCPQPHHAIQSKLDTETRGTLVTMRRLEKGKKYVGHQCTHGSTHTTPCHKESNNWPCFGEKSMCRIGQHYLSSFETKQFGMLFSRGTSFYEYRKYQGNPNQPFGQSHEGLIFKYCENSVFTNGTSFDHRRRTVCANTNFQQCVLSRTERKFIPCIYIPLHAIMCRKYNVKIALVFEYSNNNTA
jgi:hypothetical protein